VGGGVDLITALSDSHLWLRVRQRVVDLARTQTLRQDMRIVVPLFAILLASCTALPSSARATQPLVRRQRRNNPLLQVVPPPSSIAATAGSSSTGKASPAALTISIFKSVCGAGVFTLSARFLGGPGIVPATLLMFCVAAAAAWSFFLVGRAAADAGCANNEGVWAHHVGAGTTWIYQLLIILMCIGQLVQNAATMTQLVGYIGGPSSWLMSASYEVRLALIMLAVLPVSLARDLNALRHASTIATGGVLYAVGLTLVRALDGSYGASGRFSSEVRCAAMADIWATPPRAIAVFLGAVNTAFLAHLFIPRFFDELRVPTQTPQQQQKQGADTKLRAFGRVVTNAFVIAAVATATIMVCGYATFGEGTQRGLLLNSFASSDRGAYALRVATLLSVFGCYSLGFLGLRDACAPILIDRLALITETPMRLTFAASIFCLSLCFRDVARIVALRGALLGSIAIYCIPAFIFLRSERGQQASTRTRCLHYALLAFGVGMSVLGTACVLFFD
jgi:amino acid permease